MPADELAGDVGDSVTEEPPTGGIDTEPDLAAAVVGSEGAVADDDDDDGDDVGDDGAEDCPPDAAGGGSSVPTMRTTMTVAAPTARTVPTTMPAS